MKQKSKGILKKLLAVVMSILLLPTSLLVCDVSAQEDDGPEVMVVANDYLAASEKNESFYFYHPYSEHISGAYKGVSYDAKTNTLKLVNADAPFMSIYVHTFSNLAMGKVTVDVTGTCKMGALVIAGPSGVNFTGSGNLTINAPYTGTISYGGYKKQVTNAYPSNYQYECSGAGIAIQSDESVPSIDVAKELTLTIYGSSNTGHFSMENEETGYSTPGSIRMNISGNKEIAMVESKLVTYGGTATPALAWDSTSDFSEEADPDNAEVYYAPLKLSYDKVYFGIDKDGKCDLTEDNMYVKRTYEAVGYGPDYYKIVKNEEADGWSISLEESVIGSESEIKSVSANTVKARTFTQIPYDSTTGEFSLNQMTDTKYEREYKYGRLFHKDNKDYVVVQLTGAFNQAVIQNTGIETIKDYASTFGYAPFKDGAMLEKPVSIMRQENGTAYMLEKGYTCNMRRNYYANAVLKNLKQVFSPAGASSGDSGSSSSQPAAPTAQIKAPEAGQQETVDGDQYQVTTGGDNPEAEFKGTENKNEKKVTIDATVKIANTDCKITSIGKKALANNTKMQQLTIPASIQEIKEGACSGCKNLKKFTVKGKGLKKIGKNAFSKCPKLTAATLPDSVTEIGKGAFDGDSKLGKMTVNGNNLKKVGKNALRGIKKNATITIKAKNKTQFNKTVNLIKKAGNKKLKFKFKKYKK